MESARNGRRLAAKAAFVSCVAAMVVAALPHPAAAAAATGKGTVRSGGSALNVRSGPATTYAKVGTVKTGTVLTLVCRVAGEFITGDVRRSNAWNRLTTGGYVSDAYIVYGKGASLAPTCPAAKPAPKPAPVPGPQQAPASNAAFLQQIAEPARASFREYKVPASVTMAQAILESGWGKSKLTLNDRNYFGIKCFGNPGTIAVGCHTYATTECDKAGKCYSTTAVFRVYRSATDSFRDHGRFLVVNNRYKPAFAHSKNPNAFAAAIHKAGYATDPKYTEKLVGLMKAYNLYKYDR
jgi:flagellar protein FlgJ